MYPAKLAFVDIETTGGSVTRSRIIEIAILRIRQNKVERKYSTFINPQTYIDPFIQSLTGIRPEDVENAPTFENVKDEIIDILKDAIFVAHNVRFDYGFIRNELKRCGIEFSSKNLCTVKLARILFPSLGKYNLDTIIDEFQIPCKNRHRAFSDAKAIWDFYKKSSRIVNEDTFQKAVDTVLKRPSVPIGISQKILDCLPESPGVYIFYGEKGMPLYIGKSVNIRERVLSHFSNDILAPLEMKIAQQIRSIETFKTAGELGALFLESNLIKKFQPMYNRKLRIKRNMIALRKTVNENGFCEVDSCELSQVTPQLLDDIIGIFKSKRELKNKLYEIARKHSLCPKLLNLEKTKKSCFAYHIGECKGACIGREASIRYNLRFEEAFFSLKIQKWPFDGPIIIKESGECEERFLIDKWCYLGKLSDANPDIDTIEYSFDLDMYRILKRYIMSQRDITKIKPVSFLDLKDHIRSI